VAARVLDAARGGPLPLCLTVSLLDGLVLARSAFHHSLQYRSVVVHGDAHLVTDEREKAKLLATFVDHVVPGRAGQCRPPSRRELAASAVLALPLDEAAVKVHTGPPVDDEDDLALPHWAGVLPLRLAAGPPEPACELPVPAAVAAYGRPAGAVPVP
ncbi:MAG TPA: pyridoxamine 5'-phosphate oxidase family protein, partial [Frankiaceae bacterium]|nr:pyridoxamine 5'-phosphate oxidase family protein [Frankiaceae bacterium]